METKTVYGHSAELIWYLLEGATVFNKDIQSLIPWLTSCNECLARDQVCRSGACILRVIIAALKGHKIWWWAQQRRDAALYGFMKRPAISVIG